MVEPTAVPGPPAPPTRGKQRRSDIQGLRAIASLLVATFHIWFGTVSGGVDLFFVVGGFLLATTLIGELERAGRIRVGDYLRRLVSRLFPMAGLVLLVVAVVLLIRSPAVAFERNASDIFAAATYWENWHLAADATDYVAAGHAKSSVQHFWAMSTQLQVTLMLLVAFVLVGWSACRLGRSPRAAMTGVMLLATVASFVFAVTELQVQPEATYFNTFARFWEFGVGALTALVLIRWARRTPTAVRAVLATIGLLLVLTAGLLPATWLYPGPVALWPITGAVLVLLGGSAGVVPGATRLLTLKPLVWIGGYSYGLYLWSWPTLKAYLDLFPQRAAGGVPVLDGIGLLVLSIGMSWVTGRALGALTRPRPVREAAHVVESHQADPVPPTASADPSPASDRSPIVPALPDAPPTDPTVPSTAQDVEPGAEVRPPTRAEERAAARARARSSRPRLLPAVLVPLVAVASFAGVLVGPQVVERALAEQVTGRTAQSAAALQAALQAAVTSHEAPAGQYPTGFDATGPEWTVDGCLTVLEDMLDKCRYGADDAAHEVWVVGDSQVMSWAPGLRAAFGEDTSVQFLGRRLCPFTSGRPVEVAGGPDNVEPCSNHIRWILDRAATEKPDAVIITFGAWWGGNPDTRMPGGAMLAEGALPLIEELQRLDIPVVWLDSAPQAREHDECMSEFSAERAQEVCVFQVPERDQERAEQLATVFGEAGVLVVPTMNWFCTTEDLLCPEIVADQPVRSDRVHISMTYSQFLADLLRENLVEPLGLAPKG